MDANHSNAQVSTPPATFRCTSLLFHDVTDDPDSSGFRQPSARKYKHTPRQFSDYLATIAECGFQLPSPGADVDSFGDGLVVVPTFDDGGASAMRTADLLEQHGGAGMFFITTDLLGTRGFLTESNVRQLRQRGHLVGSHSCSHPDVFRSLSLEQMKSEWRLSCQRLEDILGEAIQIGSVPGGDIDRRTFRAAATSGLQHVFTSEPTLQSWAIESVMAWGRLMMVDSTTTHQLRRWLNSPGLSLLPQKVSRASKSTIKRSLGPVYRKLVQQRRAKHSADRLAANASSVADLPESKSSVSLSAVASGESRSRDTKGASRVVALINPTLHTQSTCADLIRAGINLVGIVEANPKSAGLPVRTVRRMVRQNGLLATTSSMVARAAARISDGQKDKADYSRLFDRPAIQAELDAWGGPIVGCHDYADSVSMAAIESWQPDIIVVHSQSWVTKKVRQLARSGLVLGGHPGLTPDYRGSHSPFWALANGEPEKVGWTAFHVEQGIDTGDVIAQGRTEVGEADSFMTLNWKGMKQISIALAEAILHYDATGQIARQPHDQIPEGSNYGQPTWADWKRYQKARGR